MAPNVNQYECSTEHLSSQYDFEFAVAQLLFRRDIPFRLIGAFVPNHNGTRTVMTFRDHTFEVRVIVANLLVDGSRLGPLRCARSVPCVTTGQHLWG